jgi:hypothetical protein
MSILDCFDGDRQWSFRVMMANNKSLCVLHVGQESMNQEVNVVDRLSVM